MKEINRISMVKEDLKFYIKHLDTFETALKFLVVESEEEIDIEDLSFDNGCFCDIGDIKIKVGPHEIVLTFEAETYECEKIEKELCFCFIEDAYEGSYVNGKDDQYLGELREQEVVEYIIQFITSLDIELIPVKEKKDPFQALIAEA